MNRGVIESAEDVRDIAMYSTLRWDDVAMPRCPTIPGQARHPLAFVLGFLEADLATLVTLRTEGNLGAAGVEMGVSARRRDPRSGAGPPERPRRVTGFCSARARGTERATAGGGELPAHLEFTVAAVPSPHAGL